MEGYLQRDGHKTWYRIVGELDPDYNVPGSEWVLFDGCSHTPRLEAPNRFLKTVEDFLERVETPAA